MLLRNLFCYCSNLTIDGIISLETRSEKRCEKWYFFWSQTRSGFVEPGGRPHQKFPGVPPAPPYLPFIRTFLYVFVITNTAFVWAENCDFENWPLDRGPLYTGSTVITILSLQSSRRFYKRRNHDNRWQVRKIKNGVIFLEFHSTQTKSWCWLKLA